LTDGVISLRAPTGADAEAVRDGCQDPDIRRWTSVPERYELEDAQAFIARSLERTRTGVGLDLLAFDREGRLAGCFGVPALDRASGTAEIGYWVHVAARGQGIAARGIRLLAGWLVEAQGLRTLELLVHRDNAPSRRAAERAGFSDGGERRPAPRQAPGAVDMTRSFIVYSWTAP
jgi:RimJ/RimL family protein N-acetyltransferase